MGQTTVDISNIKRAQHGSDTQNYDKEGNFKEDAFETFWQKWDKEHKGYLTWPILWSRIKDERSLNGKSKQREIKRKNQLNCFFSLIHSRSARLLRFFPRVVYLLLSRQRAWPPVQGRRQISLRRLAFLQARRAIQQEVQAQQREEELVTSLTA